MKGSKEGHVRHGPLVPAVPSEDRLDINSENSSSTELSGLVVTRSPEPKGRRYASQRFYEDNTKNSTLAASSEDQLRQAVGIADETTNLTWLRVLPGFIVPLIGVGMLPSVLSKELRKVGNELNLYIAGFQANIVVKDGVEYFGPWAIPIMSTADGLASLMAFLSGPLLGTLSDRYGRKYVLCACIFLLNLPTVPLIFTTNMWAFILLRPFGGVGQCAVAIAMAYVADWLPGEKVTGAFGIVSAVNSLVFMVAPLVGAILASYLSCKCQVWMVSLLVTLMGMAYCLTLPETEKKRTRGTHSLNPLRAVRTLMGGNPLLRLLAASLFLHALLFTGMVGTLGPYLAKYMGFDNFDLAYFIGLWGACTSLSAFASGYVGKRFGRRAPLVLAIVGSVTLTVGETFARTKMAVYTPVLALLLMGMVFPTVCGLASQLTPPEHQGVTQGGLIGIKSIADGLGPVLLGQFLVNSDQLFGHASYGFALALVFVALQALVVMKLPSDLTNDVLQVDD